jgi:protein TonB
MRETLGAFGGFGDEGHDGRRWAASLLTSTAIYVGLVALSVALGGKQIARVAQKVVDVKFIEKIVAEPPPAPPPPPTPVPEVAPPPPAAMAPVVRPDQKVRKLDKPPPPKPMVAPKEMPTAAPQEADPAQDKGIAVYGDPGKGDPAGLEGGVAQGGVLGGQVGGAIALPEDATPPVPLASNGKPVYPEAARAANRTGTVMLRVVILADGSVADVRVLRGEEPFASAALEAARKWRFEPARHQGQAITVYRIIPVNFRIEVG